MKSQVKSFFQVLSSNLFVSAAGIVTGIFIPIFLTEVEYGYWQYYLTYASYAGLLLLGFCDGMYIRIGGQDYEKLDKRQLNAMLYFMLAILLCVVCAATPLLLCSTTDPMKRFALCMVLASSFLQCVISYFTLLNQGTGRFRIYSIGNTIDRTVLLITTVLFLILRNPGVSMLLGISVVSKCIVILYYVLHSRDIVFRRPQRYAGFWKDVGKNISIGLPITLCGIISLLMGGYAKMFIEWTSGMVNLAYYSFASSSISIISQIIVAASLVVFPSLKRTDEAGVSNFLKLGENVTDLIIPFVMLCCFPVDIAVRLIVPKYTLSIAFVPVILPTIIYQSKINVLYANTYKVRRQEKKLMLKGAGALVVNVILISAFYWFTRSLLMAAAATTLSYVVWYYLLRMGTGDRPGIHDAVNLITVLCFVLINVLLDTPIALAASLVLSLAFIFVNRKRYQNLLGIVKNLTRKQ